MNTPVSFPLAKLLEEKGFDNESAHYYNEKGEELFDLDFPSLQPTKPDVYYDNPTIAEVVMWLYEKHGIWIYVDSHEFGKWCYYHRQNIPSDLSPSITKVGEYSLEDFNSPTEAYEAAIEYTLNNLI